MTPESGPGAEPFRQVPEIQVEVEGAWLDVIDPAVFLYWCAWCGAKLVKGDRVRRIRGGYGYACAACAGPWPVPPQTA